jgi:hypothetical protein
MDSTSITARLVPMNNMMRFIAVLPEKTGRAEAPLIARAGA